MLPRFIQRKTVGTEWCYDYDRGGWVQTDLQPEMLPLPEGVTLVTLDDPATLYNTIAVAVGEPTLPVRKPSWRRF